MKERVSMVDSAWLKMEQSTNLMMITGVMQFDSSADWQAVRDLLMSRLVEPFGRFRQKVVLYQLRHYWQEDDEFDLEHHLTHLTLPEPFDLATLQRHVSIVMSTPLDPQRPLWHFHLIDNYEGKSVMLARIHHAIGDGIALIRVLLSLTDAVKENEAPTKPPPTSLTPQRSKIGRLFYTAQRTITAFNKLLFSRPDNETLFKGALGVEKVAAWTKPLSLDEVKRVGRAQNATINDVLIATVGGALHRYLQEEGQTVQRIRAAVPFNLRPIDGPIRLGNQFGLIFLPIAVGIADPVARLAAVKREMDGIKQSAEPFVAYALLQGIGLLPHAIERQVMRIFGQKVTAVMTNVPGPRQKLSFAGAPVGGLIFWVPQSGGLGMGISIFSYHDTVTVGIATDASLVPQPQRIVDHFSAEFDLIRSISI